MRRIAGIILAAIFSLSHYAQSDPPAHKNMFDMTPDAPASAPALLRVPSENELVNAKRRLDDLYAVELANAKTPEKKLDLAESLMVTAVEEKTDHAAQFQLLTTARDLRFSILRPNFARRDCTAHRR